MSQYKILLVDDSENVLKSLYRIFRPEGHEIFLVTSADEALNIMQQTSVDVIITDESMPGVTGTELLQIVKKRYPETVRIMITGTNDIEVAKNAINSGDVYRFFTKPWDDFELVLSVRYALKEKTLKKENENLKEVIKKQNSAMEKLEKEFPGIAQRNVDTDGCIVIK